MIPTELAILLAVVVLTPVSLYVVTTGVTYAFYRARHRAMSHNREEDRQDDQA